MTTWRDAALCSQVDPELFFPEKGKPAAPAIRVCMACEVRPQCLELALQTRQKHGVWGGYSEKDLRRLIRFRDARLAG